MYVYINAMIKYITVRNKPSCKVLADDALCQDRNMRGDIL